MRVDVKVFAPFDHTLENADETLEALGSNPSQLVRRRADLESLSAAGDFRHDVDETFEDVCRRQITVIVDVNVDDHLSKIKKICRNYWPLTIENVVEFNFNNSGLKICIEDVFKGFKKYRSVAAYFSNGLNDQPLLFKRRGRSLQDVQTNLFEKYFDLEKSTLTLSKSSRENATILRVAKSESKEFF